MHKNNTSPPTPCTHLNTKPQNVTLYENNKHDRKQVKSHKFLFYLVEQTKTNIYIYIYEVNFKLNQTPFLLAKHQNQRNPKNQIQD